MKKERIKLNKISKKFIIVVSIILILSFFGREDNFSGGVTKNVQCSLNTDCSLRVGDIVIIDENSVKLLRIGSTGAIIVDVDGIIETIHRGSSKEIKNLIIENKGVGSKKDSVIIIIRKSPNQPSTQTQDINSNGAYEEIKNGASKIAVDASTPTNPPCSTTKCYNLNGDQIIGLGDLVLLGKCYSSTTSDCLQKVDFNNDGKIDDADKECLNKHWGEKTTSYVMCNPQYSLSCKFGEECILNVGDIASIEEDKIKLIKIGSSGSIIIEYNGVFITIHAENLNKIRKSRDIIITIENKEAKNNIATLIITKKIVLTQKIFEKFKPFREDFYCFFIENRDRVECSNYWMQGTSSLRSMCPHYYNPVCGTDGRFYPSACWAEQLGTTVSFYGYCPSLIDFFKALWREEGFEVPSPNIEFSYIGSAYLGWKRGVWLRSILWEDSQNYNMLDYNILDPNIWETTDLNLIRETEFVKFKTFFPVIANSPKVLLVFIMFDEAYPEQILLDWTSKYEPFMNNYIAKKQKVPNPIQYDLVPVVIYPPKDVERISTTHLRFSSEEIQKIYNSAISKIKQSDFDVLVVSPVILDGFGGEYTIWKDMELINAPLSPPESYSITDKQKGLNALAEFQAMFGIISHEVLHAIGLQGDHVPMGYGTTYLSITMSPGPTGQNVDPITGKERIGPRWCDILGSSPDYYAVELPNNLKIYVNQEPNWLFKTESSSGSCLYGIHNNEILKDYDNDGEYEIMYANNLIGAELQRSLGWVDMDGDGISELIDPDAYGGWYSLK